MAGYFHKAIKMNDDSNIQNLIADLGSSELHTRG